LTIKQAVDDGDELAKSLERERALHEQLLAALSVERELRAEVARSERALAREIKRADWLEVSQADVAADLAAAREELDMLRQREVEAVSDDQRRPTVVDRAANRAQRRRAARQRS
jgi:hypothetical protein